MWRRFRQIVLPALLILLISEFILIIIILGLRQSYRSASNSEISNLLGVVAQRYPDLDSAELLHNFSQFDADTMATGNQILHESGFLSSDFAATSADHYSEQVLITSVLVLIGSIAVISGYFWYRDWYQRRQITSFTEYVRKLNQRVYDLRIKTNTEDELSQLSNELYKITVTLQESAEYDRRTRQQLETALADISHQLKTPLTSLQVVLDNLYHDLEMPPEIRQDFLLASSRQVSDMSNLITTLLNLAKFDNGTIKLQRYILPIGQILDRVCAKLEILADLQDIQVNISGDLSAQVKLDPHWQTEALANILKNCLEHSQAGSTITIRVEDSLLYTRITICDTGEGIAPQDLHHIFERFYKANGASPSSVGIGLSFAKSIIEADHGHIRAKSTLGEGTEFCITYLH